LDFLLANIETAAVISISRGVLLLFLTPISKITDRNAERIFLQLLFLILLSLVFLLNGGDLQLDSLVAEEKPLVRPDGIDIYPLGRVLHQHPLYYVNQFGGGRSVGRETDILVQNFILDYFWGVSIERKLLIDHTVQHHSYCPHIYGWVRSRIGL